MLSNHTKIPTINNENTNLDLLNLLKNDIVKCDLSSMHINDMSQFLSSKGPQPEASPTFSNISQHFPTFPVMSGTVWKC